MITLNPDEYDKRVWNISYPNYEWMPKGAAYIQRKKPPYEENILIRESSRTQTETRIAMALKYGYKIINGNNRRLPDTIKYRNYYVICLRQTNSTTHGKCIATTFAVKKP